MAEENIKEQGSSKTKTCFVIMPISDNPDYAQGHFRRVYEYIIKPACKKAGYEAIRADDTVKTNDIVSDIIKKIIDSDMAICDMSSRNPNVFYELGLRHAFNLKTTLIKDKKTSRAFDIAGLRSVEYDESLRVDEVEKAVMAIADAIEETENMTSEEPNSTIQLLGLSAPAKKVKLKTMSGENAAIMGEIRSLHNDVELFLIGDETKLESFKNNPKCKIVNSETILAMDVDPMTALKDKKSSLMVAISTYLDNKCDFDLITKYTILDAQVRRFIGEFRWENCKVVCTN